MHLPKKETLLAIDHATVRYLDKILFPDLSFQVEQGQHWAILGKSGSGKTALLQVIQGKYNITGGTIRYPFFQQFLRDQPQTDTPLSYRQFIGNVSFQPHFKNKQNTDSFYYQQRFHAWDAEEAITVQEYFDQTLDRIKDYLPFVGLRFPMNWITEQFRMDYLLDKTLIQLSNGETRRLLFAEALLRQPRLLLLDNPLTGLDAESRAFYSELLSKIAAEGTTLLMVTSRQEIPACISHVLELEGGAINGTWARKDFPLQEQNTGNRWQPDQTKLDHLIKDQSSANDHQIIVGLKDIYIRYGHTVILDHVNWTVKQGEKWALTGHNGAGKSTLLSLITGDNPQAYANDITLFDKKRGRGESIWDIKKKIGYVSPELHQYFPYNSSSLDVILSGFTDTMAPIRKRISDGQRALGCDWLALFQIAPLQEQQFKFISAGGQRLVLLIRALVKNPPLLILDEPCQGLDRDQKDHFISIIEQLCHSGDKTLIYVSHYKEEIPRCVTHFMMLEGGRFKQVVNSQA